MIQEAASSTVPSCVKRWTFLRHVALVGLACLPGCELILDVPPKRDVTLPDGSRGEAPRDAAAEAAPVLPQRDASIDAGPLPHDAAGPRDAGASSPADGSRDAAPDAPCVGDPVLWYVDDDRDGYGRSSLGSDVRSSCSRPGEKWAILAGDCNDEDARVHPGQVTYFGTPSHRSDAAVSFDYDCSGAEEGDPNLLVAPKNCGLLSLALCGGFGYTATDRVAAGANTYCGSSVWSTCEATGLGLLLCEATTVTRDPPYGCR
jgi:hypothetical protein